MKRVILTGGAGFVGANLARRLVLDGHEVHLLVHPASDLWRLAGLRRDARLHCVDLEDTEAVGQVVRTVSAEWVFHAAAHGAYPDQDDVYRMISTNLVGTVNLVEAASATGFEAFVHTGSSSEYGAKDHAPSEDAVLEPNSAYAVTKAAATHYCRHVAAVRGIAIRVLRLYSVYGPWEEPTRLMPRLVVKGLRGAWPPMARPSTARDYVYIDDIVDAYLAAATVADQPPGALYNVGTGVQTSLRELTGIARAELGVPSDPAWGTFADRAWDAATWVADPTAACKALGWSARHDVASGLRSFAGWFRDQPSLLASYEMAAE